LVDVKKIAEFLSKRLTLRGIDIERLIIFGSKADGDGDCDSDVDFAVVSSSFEGKDLYERGKIISIPVAETIWKFDVPIDLVALTPSEFLTEDRMICVSIKNGKTLISN
jgi:predicted nucleotidyltransferase